MNCSACRVKDDLIAALRSEIEYQRSTGGKLTDCLVALADNTAHAKIAMAQAVRDRAESAARRSPPPTAQQLRNRPDMLTEREEALLRDTLAADAEAAKPKEKPVAPDTRAEIEATFETAKT